MKLDEAEQGVVALCAPRKSSCVSSKLSTVNPPQPNLGPPSARPVPIPTPRKPRKKLVPTDQTVKNKADTKEKPFCFLLQKMAAKVSNSSVVQIDRVPKDVPRRPSPPTPEKLKEFCDRRRQLINESFVARGETELNKSLPNKQRSECPSNKNEGDRKKCESHINANKMSKTPGDKVFHMKDIVDKINSKTQPNVTGSITEEKLDDRIDEPIVNARKLCRNQKWRAAPKPRQRKNLCNNTMEDSEPATAQSPEFAPRLRSLTEQDSPRMKPKARKAHPEPVTAQSPEVAPKLGSSTEQASPTMKPKVRNINPDTKMVQTPEMAPGLHSLTEQDSPKINPKWRNGNPKQWTKHPGQETPRLHSPTQQKSPTTRPKVRNTTPEEIMTHLPVVTSGLHSPTEQDFAITTNARNKNLEQITKEVIPRLESQIGICSTRHYSAEKSLTHEQDLLNLRGASTMEHDNSSSSSNMETLPKPKPKPKPRTKAF